MLKSYQGREFAGIDVGVYRNLKTGEWSAKALEGPDKGKKVAEGDSCTLLQTRPFVSKAVRNRIVARKAAPEAGKAQKGFREVHAWIVGRVLIDDVLEVRDGDRKITYRPFEREDFFYTDSGESFDGAEGLTFSTGGDVFQVSI
jgi:hypothetical protein